LNVVFLGPMKIPIPSEKGAVEDIIWQLAKRVSGEDRAWIFNPILLKNNKIRSYGATWKLMPWTWERETVIHSHNPYASLAIMGSPRVKRHLLTLHYPPWISDRAVENKIFIRLLRTLDQFSITITVPNTFIRDWLMNRGIRSVYLPNGVDINSFNPSRRDEALRASLLGDRADTLVVNLGRIDDTKNQLTLLRSFNEVLKTNPRIKLVMIGPKSGTFQGSGTSTYANQVASFIQTKGLSDHVEWLGEVGTKLEVAKILASCDLYAHPSKIEAAPLAVLEAMASGLSILAFDLPWYKGYLSDNVNAILCRYSPEAFTESLCAAIKGDKSENHRWRQHQLTKNFSWDELITEYKKFYRA